MLHLNLSRRAIRLFAPRQLVVGGVHAVGRGAAHPQAGEHVAAADGLLSTHRVNTPLRPERFLRSLVVILPRRRRAVVAGSRCDMSTPERPLSGPPSGSTAPFLMLILGIPAHPPTSLSPVPAGSATRLRRLAISPADLSRPESSGPNASSPGLGRSRWDRTETPGSSCASWWHRRNPPRSRWRASAARGGFRVANRRRIARASSSTRVPPPEPHPRPRSARESRDGSSPSYGASRRTGSCPQTRQSSMEPVSASRVPSCATANGDPN